MEKLRKILFLIDVWYPMYGGGVRHVEEITQCLVLNHGYDVTVLTRTIVEPGKIVKPVFAHPHFHFVSIGRPSRFASLPDRLWWLIAATWRGWRLGPFDVLHGQANLGGIPAKLIGWLTRRPVVYTVHGSGVKVWDKLAIGITARVMQRIEYWVQCKIRYDAEISVSRDFFQLPGNVNQRRYVIPNGVDTAVYRLGDPSKRVKGRLLFVGRLHPQKGLSVLLQALSEMREDGWSLHIVGDGPLDSKLRQQAQILNISHQVTFTGPKFGLDLISEYHEAEIFVLPSYYEGQPLTLLEAWSTGLPVVASNVGANDDMMSNGFGGILVPPGNVVMLRRALLKLLADPQLDHIGRLARERVERQYSWPEVTKKIDNVYTHVLEC